MTTPMFQQYHELKANHPDAILFFRMGDFYEVFFEDAKVASKVLDITLTSRNRNDPEPIPMAGVPHHAATAYVQKLTSEGYRVAIAEQVEDPSQAKGIVRREVVKVVTPGIALDSSYLDSTTGVYVGAVASSPKGWGLAFFDVSTGELKVTQVGDEREVFAEIGRIQPMEMLICPTSQATQRLQSFFDANQMMVSDIEAEAWRTSEAERELCQTLGVSSLKGYAAGDFPDGVRAAGAVVRYGRTQSGGTIRNLHRLQTYHVHEYMVLDETTRRNLELTRTLLDGQKKGSLIWLLDETETAMGSRLLRDWLSFPLMNLDEIKRRQDAVGAMIQMGHERETLCSLLSNVADIERITSRITQGTGGPRDLSALRRSLSAIPDAMRCIESIQELESWVPSDCCGDVRGELEQWLVEDPPISTTEGGLIQQGNHEALDELISLSIEGVRLISDLEEKERNETGISSLKIRRNRVFGYYIEVTRAHLHKVPERYLRKQTLTNAERYITADLKELEDKVLGADERRKSLEYSLFCELRERIALQAARLGALARAIAALDTLSNLAGIAVKWDWNRPSMTDALTLHVQKGRHPVVEALLTEDRFIPNDAYLEVGERQLVILTGPNMSGKSTTMRQVAIISLLGQIGSYVPASAAVLGLCDRIFTRVGAADNLSQGQSTFMVEMAETAAILHHATARSLLVLDEIGRGTSTYDGLSIAWAVAEDIARNIGCRAFFATHYHELCQLQDKIPFVYNQSVAVTEADGRIIFLRSLRDGGASKSYGIQCARLAGLPERVVTRAHAMLSDFERNAPRDAQNQLSLFATQRPAPSTVPPELPETHPAMAVLETLDPDELSPRQALQALYQLKDLL